MIKTNLVKFKTLKLIWPNHSASRGALGQSQRAGWRVRLVGAELALTVHLRAELAKRCKQLLIWTVDHRSNTHDLRCVKWWMSAVGYWSDGGNQRMKRWGSPPLIRNRTVAGADRWSSSSLTNSVANGGGRRRREAEPDLGREPDALILGERTVEVSPFKWHGLNSWWSSEMAWALLGRTRR